MEPNGTSSTTGDGEVLDQATLYLGKQGATWVVVIESPRVRGAVRLRYAGRDSFDARFELLSTARRACPEASIVTTAAAGGAGELGAPRPREPTTKPAPHGGRLARRRAARTCQWGSFRVSRGRPLSF